MISTELDDHLRLLEELEADEKAYRDAGVWDEDHAQDLVMRRVLLNAL